MSERGFPWGKWVNVSIGTQTRKPINEVESYPIKRMWWIILEQEPTPLFICNDWGSSVISCNSIKLSRSGRPWPLQLWSSSIFSSIRTGQLRTCWIERSGLRLRAKMQTCCYETVQALTNGFSYHNHVIRAENRTQDCFHQKVLLLFPPFPPTFHIPLKGTTSVWADIEMALWFGARDRNLQLGV